MGKLRKSRTKRSSRLRLRLLLKSLSLSLLLPQRLLPQKRILLESKLLRKQTFLLQQISLLKPLLLQWLFLLMMMTLPWSPRPLLLNPRPAATLEEEDDEDDDNLEKIYNASDGERELANIKKVQEKGETYIKEHEVLHELKQELVDYAEDRGEKKELTNLEKPLRNATT